MTWLWIAYAFLLLIVTAHRAESARYQLRLEAKLDELQRALHTLEKSRAD